jgi:hypothetical protein
MMNTTYTWASGKKSSPGKATRVSETELPMLHLLRSPKVVPASLSPERIQEGAAIQTASSHTLVDLRSVDSQNYLTSPNHTNKRPSHTINVQPGSDFSETNISDHPQIKWSFAEETHPCLRKIVPSNEIGKKISFVTGVCGVTGGLMSGLIAACAGSSKTVVLIGMLGPMGIVIPVFLLYGAVHYCNEEILNSGEKNQRILQNIINQIIDESLLQTASTIHNMNAQTEFVKQVIYKLIEYGADEEVFNLLKPYFSDLMRNGFKILHDKQLRTLLYKHFIRPEEQIGLSNLRDYSEFFLKFSIDEIKNALIEGNSIESPKLSLTEDKENYFVRHNNRINVILAQSINSEDQALRAHAQELVDFCNNNLPLLQEMRKTANQDIFQIGNPNHLMIFFSENGIYSAIMEIETYAQLRHPTSEHIRPWNRVALYQDVGSEKGRSSYQNIAVINQRALFTEILPCFSVAYRLENDQLPKVIGLLCLARQDEQHFISATGYKIYKEKKYPTTSNAGHDLERKFGILWDEALHWEDRKITSEFTQKIFAQLGLSDSSPAQQALALYILSGLFAQYSSKEIFGENLLSSEPLRYLSMAFFNKAKELDSHAPSIFRDNITGPWKRNLAGFSSEGDDTISSCTATLYRDMLGALTKLNQPSYRKIVNELIPVAWR